MVKMRTEPANYGGGGSVVAVGPMITTKSRQDVEAAFAIAQLSEQDPRPCGVTTSSQLMNGCSHASSSRNPSTFSHMMTAVMPRTTSRVEKAPVKRRFDSPDGGAVVSYKQFRLHDVSDPIQRAIVSERGTFMTARRHQHQVTTDTAGDSELVGRFVRTCGPSGRDEVQRQLYVKVSDHTTSPTLVSSMPSLFTTSSNSDCEDDKPPVLSPAVTVDSYQPLSVSQRRHRLDHTDTLNGTSKRYLLPAQYRQHIPTVLKSYEDRRDKKLMGRGMLKSSACADNGKKPLSSLVSAFYNLGQSAAAAATAQLMFVKPQFVTSRPQSTVTSRPIQSTGCQSRLPVRRVDSCTLEKVRRGEFGVLSTLRTYCSQLRRHSEPARSMVAVSQSSDDEEVAVDLSVRKHADDGHRADGARTSRSCGSSPASTVTLGEGSEHWQTVEDQSQQRSTSRHHRQQAISLPSSPYTGRYDNHHRDDRAHSPLCVQHSIAAAAGNDDDDGDRGDVTESSDVIPDSQLPLKKRRLHYNHQQESVLPVISEDSCDKQWINADHSDNRRRG